MTVKTCEYGHHWYIGETCPLCDFLGRENLRKAYADRGVESGPENEGPLRLTGREDETVGQKGSGE